MHWRSIPYREGVFRQARLLHYLRVWTDLSGEMGNQATALSINPLLKIMPIGTFHAHRLCQIGYMLKYRR